MAQNAPSFFSRFGSGPASPSEKPKLKRKPSTRRTDTMPPVPVKRTSETTLAFEPSRPAPRPPARANSTPLLDDPSGALRHASAKNASSSSISANAGSSASSRRVLVASSAPSPAPSVNSRPLSPRQLGKRPAHSPIPQLIPNPPNPLPVPPKASQPRASSSSTRATPSPVPPPVPMPPPPPIPPATSVPVAKSNSDSTAPKQWNPYRPITPDVKRYRTPRQSVDMPRAESSKHPSQPIPPSAPIPPPQNTRPRPSLASTEDVTMNLARMILTPPHTQRMVTYPGTSQYAAGAPSACGLTSLNAVRCALQLEQAIRAGGGTVGTGSVGLMILGSMTKLEFVKDVMGIAPHWRSADHLEVEDVLGLPMFERSLTCIGTEQRITSKKNFREILSILQSTRTTTSAAAGVLITRPPEIISIIHFPASLPSPPPPTFAQAQAATTTPLQHVFAIFDSHPRPTHPTGSAFVVSASIDQTARYLEKLFAVDQEIIDDGGALLGAFDAHFVVSGDHATVPRTAPTPGPLHVMTTDPDVYAANMGMLHAQLEARTLRTQGRRELESVLEQLRRSEAAYIRERRLRESRDAKCKELQRKVKEFERAERERERQGRAAEGSRSGSRREARAESVPVEEGKDPLAEESSPLKILTPDEKGSLFGEEKQSEADTARASEEQAGIEVSKDEAMEEIKEVEEKDEAKIEVPIDTAVQRSSTGLAWGVISTFGRGIPFWSSAAPVNRVEEVDPSTIPTPLTPKAAPLPIPDESYPAPEITFHCDICQDNEPEVDVAIIDGCGHRFGRDCIKGFVSSKLSDGKFPIVCPTCATGEGEGPPGIITSWLAESVGMTENEYQRWTQLELAAYSFALECTQCERSYMVSRDDYNDPSTKEFRCAMPDCDHVWCKSCSTTIEKGQTHTCDGSAELTRLMEKEGWRACPGCQTPIEKNEGCNHISCTTPACNTHFCYVCGGKVVQSVIRNEINEAIMAHFAHCKLFDVPDEV